MSLENPEKTSLTSTLITAQQVIQHLSDGVVITDANCQILAINPAFTASTGYKFSEVSGKNPRIFKSTKHKLPFFKKMWLSLETRGQWQGELTNRRKNGEEFTEWVSITAIRDNEGRLTHYLAVYTDITKKKRAEETIKQLAQYDPLTGLPNKTFFRTLMEQAIDQVKRTNSQLAVLFLDLDRVKVINDTLGYKIGDALLKAVAERIESCLLEGETLSRLGGDEFMILLPKVDHINAVARTTERVIETLNSPFNIDGHELYITASIGISLYPDDGEDVDTLYKNADTAMYRAKKQGRNNYQVFKPDMKDEVFEQLVVGNNLRRALQNREFVLHYQPQLDLGTGKIIGMEALVRWQHPDLGLIPPGKFIKWAEDTGLIVPLGDWVLRKACEQNKAWQDAGLPPMRVSVNLSATQFKEDDFVEKVEQILEETKMPAECLDLELTESVIMANMDSTEAPFDLRALGVRFSIDDFGTGYSSLSYLKHFPVNTIKMDRSFVRDIATDPSDAAIAMAVITLGHGLNVSVMAEGVETQDQLAMLRSLKCDKMQGYLFSKPLPAEEFEALLRSDRELKEETLFG